MALTQRLEIRQNHALVMTPQLMQAIKLLQLSYVEGELERNPLLERTGEDDGEAGLPHSELSPQSSDWVQASREGNEPPRQLDVDEIRPADSAASRSDSEDPIGYSEWAGIGTGGGGATSAIKIGDPFHRSSTRWPNI